MAIKLNTIGISNMVEEYYEEDGSIVVKYKTFHPSIGDDGFLDFSIKNIESVKIFDEVN